MLNSLFKRSALVAACISFSCVYGCGGGSPSQPSTPAAAATGSTTAAASGSSSGSGSTGTGGNGGDSGSTGSSGSSASNGSGTTSGTGGSGGSGGGTGTGTGTGTAAPAAPQHHRCGWIGGDTADAGAATFAANPDFFDAIHPVWFTANADGTIAANSHADDSRITTVAKAHKVLLMPLIYGGDDGSIVRNIMSSPASITAHVTNLVNLVESKGYDGLEVDYEHLWTQPDRAPFVAMLTQLATALHAKGKQLSIATSPQTADDGNSAYGLVALANGGVDVIHYMGYDYHSIDSDHTGPLAPLGWIDAAGAHAKALGIADKVIMGLANYGVGHGWYVSSIAGSISACGGTYATTTTHMQTCPYGVWTAGTSPHCTTAQGDLWFEDVTSIGEKAQTAAKNGLRGITYYTLGSEPAGFFDALKAAYPN
jgi:chitinase